MVFPDSAIVSHERVAAAAARFLAAQAQMDAHYSVDEKLRESHLKEAQQEWSAAADEYRQALITYAGVLQDNFYRMLGRFDDRDDPEEALHSQLDCDLQS